MASVEAILARIRTHGANVILDDGKIRVVNGRGLPDGAVSYITTHSREIAAFLEKEAEFEERAAMMEFDGGLTRASAEYITRFLMGSPPEGTSPVEWQWFVNEAAKLIDSGLSRAA